MRTHRRTFMLHSIGEAALAITGRPVWAGKSMNGMRR